MYYQTIDTTKGELVLSLTRQDLNDLGFACCMGERAARGDGLDNDPALAGRLGLMLTVFMVGWEAVKADGDEDGAR